MATLRTCLLCSLAVHGALLGWAAAGGWEARGEDRVPFVAVVEFPPAPPAARAEPTLDAPPVVCEPEPFLPPALPDTEWPCDEVRVDTPPVELAAPVVRPRVELTPANARDVIVRRAMRDEPLPVAPAAVSPPPLSVVLVPIAGTNEPPDYPPLARRRGWHGTVVVRIACDGHGDVTSAMVVRSSGHPVLDDAALAVARRWRFANGPGSVDQPFTFRLHGARSGG